MPVYTKPPVKEALVQILITPQSKDLLPALNGLHLQLKDKYPKSSILHRWTGFWKMQDESIETSHKSLGPIGYRFESDDKKQVLQLQLDGFTMNRLKADPQESWPGWDNVKDEARRAWNLYVEVVSPLEITRLGVRYINQIVIPAASVKLEDYLTAAPSLPKDLPFQDFDQYLSRMVVNIPDSAAKAIITQLPAEAQIPGFTTLILDIDVFSEERVALDSAKIWGTLDQLRELKNTIFEASLQQRAKDLFL